MKTLSSWPRLISKVAVNNVDYLCRRTEISGVIDAMLCEMYVDLE
jgi:hypothetical protein